MKHPISALKSPHSLAVHEEHNSKATTKSTLEVASGKKRTDILEQVPLSHVYTQIESIYM